MQYSPKLKRAMQEIKDILSRADIAGVVILHTPEHIETMVKLDPSYSCVKVNGDQVRVRARLLADFGGNKAAWRKTKAETANMLHALSMGAGKAAIPLMALSEKVDQMMDARHTDGGFTSDKTQNN